MITPEQKDQILKYICDECEYEETSKFRPDEFSSIVSLNTNELEGLLSQFSRMGLIGSNIYVSETRVLIQKRIEAEDFLRIGGFTAKEKALKQNIEKLNLEVQNLRKNPSDPLAAITNITTIATNILSFFGKT